MNAISQVDVDIEGGKGAGMENVFEMEVGGCGSNFQKHGLFLGWGFDKCHRLGWRLVVRSI